MTRLVEAVAKEVGDIELFCNGLVDPLIARTRANYAEQIHGLAARCQKNAKRVMLKAALAAEIRAKEDERVGRLETTSLEEGTLVVTTRQTAG